MASAIFLRGVGNAMCAGRAGAGKQKHNLLNVVMFLRALAQGRHMALTTWMATGIVFNVLFFKCGGTLPRRYAWGQGLFNIMPIIRRCRLCVWVCL